MREYQPAGPNTAVQFVAVVEVMVSLVANTTALLQRYYNAISSYSILTLNFLPLILPLSSRPSALLANCRSIAT